MTVTCLSPGCAAGEILSTVSHIMVPNPTKSIVAETQSRLTDIVHELQRNLSKLMVVIKDEDYRTPSSVGRCVCVCVCACMTPSSVGRCVCVYMTPLVYDGTSIASLNFRTPSLEFSEDSSSEVLPVLGSEVSSSSKEGVAPVEGVSEGSWSSYPEGLFAIGEGKEEEEEEEEEGGVSPADKVTIIAQCVLRGCKR